MRNKKAGGGLSPAGCLAVPGAAPALHASSHPTLRAGPWGVASLSAYQRERVTFSMSSRPTPAHGQHGKADLYASSSSTAQARISDQVTKT
jgi:hypothetical protein